MDGFRARPSINRPTTGRLGIEAKAKFVRTRKAFLVGKMCSSHLARSIGWKDDNKMNWLQLLNTTRVKELYGQGTSIKSPSDFRGEFERDYGRTVFSTPVRRLQDK